MLLLYNSLFLPYISYCGEVWANTYKSKLNALIVLQKRVIRLINNNNNLYSNSTYYNAHLQSYCDRIARVRRVRPEVQLLIYCLPS